MSCKFSTTLFVCVCLVVISGSLYGQNSGTTQGIRGYLDPRTGTFHSVPLQATLDGEPPAVTTFTGKFVVNFTVTVSSAIATTAKIACIVDATLEDSATLNLIEESATVDATRSGSTASCTVTIPYSWNLGSASSDKVSLGYSLAAAGTTGVLSRISTQSIGTISVPANGATTTETVKATI